MAIYSFNHDSFGKTTSRARAAGDNIRYNADLSKTQMEVFLRANAGHLEEHGVHRSDEEIEAHLHQIRGGRSAAENAAYNARREATYAVRSHIIPPEPAKAQAWFDAQERADRKNARMSDRFIGALPRELTPDQCLEVVENFCRTVTRDRIPWHFALHLELEHKHEPDWNPHTHIVFRDRDIESGKRFLFTTAGPKERAQLAARGIHAWSTKDLRVAWNDTINRGLERAGAEARVDHRSLEEQGIDRAPQIHVGPASKKAAGKGHRFESRDGQVGERTVPYTILDDGTRAEHNDHIIDANRWRQAGGAEQRPNRADPELLRLQAIQTRTRRAMLLEQRLDRKALRDVHDLELDQHKAWAKELYAGARQIAFDQVKEQTADRWLAVRAIQDSQERERAAGKLQKEQKALYQTLSSARVAEARAEKNGVWLSMRERQTCERHELRDSHRVEAAAISRQHAAEALAHKEQRSAVYFQRRTNSITRRVMGHQGMANQQRAANETILLKLKADMDPNQAARAFTQAAVAEQGRRASIRAELNRQRQSNRLKVGAFKQFCDRAGEISDNCQRNADADRQNQTRQAIRLGLATGEQRATASPELRDIISRQDRRMRMRETTPLRSTERPQSRGRGRDGGGRER
jgi:hypothetical protein